MKLYFGTVIRKAPVNQSGSIYKLDWDRKQVVAERLMVPKDPSLEHDPNTRGNARGCRGIQVVGNDIIAANYHTLNVYDRDLNLKRTLSHGLMVGLHETFVDGNSIWVTSTSTDSAIKYNLRTGALEDQYWPREMPAFQEALGVEPMDVDKSADNRAAWLDTTRIIGPSHLHLNAVCVFRGEVYALFHSQCCVANLTRGTVVIRNENLKHAHNLIIEEPGVVWINDTHRCTIRQYELATGREICAINLRRQKYIGRLLLKSGLRAMREMGLRFFGSGRKATARPLYLRGLTLNRDYVFAGFSPATIVCLDKHSGEVLDYYFHTTDVRVCVHGLVVDPAVP
jgi:hypothetical protein